MSFLRAATTALALALAASTAAAAPAGFAFLEVPVGARAAAMGGAYSSLATGVEGAFWNPAGLERVEGTQVTGSHVESFQGLKHDQFAIAGQLFGGGLAASMRAMYSQAIDERDDVGNLIGTWGSHDLEFQLAYGRHLTRSIAFGVGAQMVRERIANTAADTWSSSVGLRWLPVAWQGVAFGLAVDHMGPPAYYTFDGQKGAAVPLPTAMQAGGSLTHALGHGLGLTVALDGRAADGRQPVWALGGELTTQVGASVRAGARAGDDVSNFTAGMGWQRGGFRLDYAWAPSKLDLGDTHRFSFTTQF